MFKQHCLVGVVCLFGMAGLTGCAPVPGGTASGPKVGAVKPIEAKRPVKEGEVASGAGTLEGVRRQLEGKWELISLEVVDASGKQAPVQATGRMTYDAYGNFDLAVQIDPAAATALGANATLDVKGRAVIDVANSSLRVQDVDAAGAAPREGNLARTRYYAFEGDTLTLSTRDAAGRVASSTKWKRQP